MEGHLFPKIPPPPGGPIFSWSSLPLTSCFYAIIILHLVSCLLVSALTFTWTESSVLEVMENLKCQGKSPKLNPESIGAIYAIINLFNKYF